LELRIDSAVTQKPINVVHLIARMNVGGPAILLSSLVQGLNGDGFKSHLVTGYCEENEVDYLEANGLQLDEIRIKGLGRTVSPLTDLKALFSVMRTLRKLKPDIVHTHTAKAGVIGRVTALIAVPRAKRVHTFHGHLLQGYFSKSKTRLVVLLERTLAKITHLILTVGSQVAKDLQEAGIGNPAKMQVTYPGIKVTVSSQAKENRNSLGLPGDEVVLIYVGRLTQIKRVDRLIEAFKLAQRDCPNVTLLIVGDGELKEELLAKSYGLKIKFLGWRTDVYELMSASDVAILTSDNEGMPITLIEAAFMGLPSVTTDVGSACEVVLNAATGYVTTKDPTVIAEKIKQLVISESLRAKFGDAAKLHAQEKFSVDSMLTFHKATYKSLLNRA
jgi:glycosyltransferase involved in cell wall biosynthesis